VTTVFIIRLFNYHFEDEPMIYLWATLLVLLNTLWLGCSLFYLPGNWLMIITTVFFAWWQAERRQQTCFRCRDWRRNPRRHTGNFSDSHPHHRHITWRLRGCLHRGRAGRAKFRQAAEGLCRLRNKRGDGTVSRLESENSYRRDNLPDSRPGSFYSLAL
jgi:hypothetical protein